MILSVNQIRHERKPSYVTIEHMSQIICASVHSQGKQNVLRKIVINVHIVLERLLRLFFKLTFAKTNIEKKEIPRWKSVKIFSNTSEALLENIN